MFKKKNKVVQDMNICEGIKICDTIYSKKENRMWTLIYKGLIIYMLSASGVCGIISASKTAYTPILINVLIFIAAMYVACIHYNKKWENIGNIIFLIILIIGGFGCSLYMNSGFYAVLNDINEEAKIYFDYTGIRTYAEPINNRLLAVNIAAIAIGIISCFAHYMWISKMMYLDSILLVLLMYVYPVYVQCEPDLIYVIMALCGTTMMYILKKSTHYSTKQEDSVLNIEDDKPKKRKQLKAIFKKDKDIISKKNISYTYNIKAISTVGAWVVVIVFALVLLMQIVIPKKTYYDNEYDTTLKTKTKEQVGTFVRQGFAGLYNFYENVAGMSDGRLGGVGIVNLDYNTDFKLRVTPYSEDTLYLKSKSYVNYIPFKNEWKSIYESIDQFEARDYELADYNEADTLKKAYDNKTKDNKEKVAKGILEIENVGLVDTLFKPYYTCMNDMERVKEKEIKITYYPRLDKTTTKIKKDINLTPYLRYPAENEETIVKLLKDAKVKRDMDADTVVHMLAAYFQEEMPYTLNPGITPLRKDFINYFLEEHRKGYCVHFASTATLALRYMGIPARYVEGYAVKLDDILAGTALKNKEYKDYYDGYSEFGETALIEVEVTDASAHAWVEIYDENYGWKPVEVTPSAVNEDTGTGSFWNRFMGIFLGGGNDSAGSEEGSSASKEKDTKEDFFTSDIVRGLVMIIIIAVVIWLLIITVKYVIYKMKYNKANINDKLIYDYSNLIRKRRRKYRALKEMMNYNSQIEYLYKQHLFRVSVDENVMKKTIDILDEAGFSDKMISEENDKFIREILGI